MILHFGLNDQRSVGFGPVDIPLLGLVVKIIVDGVRRVVNGSVPFNLLLHEEIHLKA
jgi:hypothetical protein